MKWQVHVFALGVFASSLPAFANMESDNLVWAAKPAEAASDPTECTANAGRQVSAASDATGDPLARMLKVAGRLAGIAAFSAATKATSVPGPNPCRRF
jgi:hypothetical protein